MFSAENEETNKWEIRDVPGWDAKLLGLHEAKWQVKSDSIFRLF